MKQDKRNLETKLKLANSLIDLMEEKAINSITIKDITKKANCNRNTFYYHFVDIYDLINWIFENETEKFINEVDINKPDKLLNTIFTYIEENKEIISFIYNSIGREKLRELLQPYFHLVINDLYQKKNTTNHDENFKNFLIDFYSGAVANVLLNYINNNYKNKEEIINYILITINNSII